MFLRTTLFCVSLCMCFAACDNTQKQATTTPTKQTITTATSKTAPKAAKPKTIPAKTNKRPTPTGNGVEVLLQSSKVKSGTQTCVEVSVKGFNEVVSMQYSINWNPAELSFSEVKDFQLKDLTANNFGTQKSEQGKLTFSWYDQAIKGISKPDGSVIHQLCFDAKAQKGTTSKILITEDPIIVEITGAGGKFLKFFTEPAYIEVE